MRRRIGSLRYHVDDGHTTKISLKKWIRVLSISIAIIPTRLLCQMQANSSGAEFLRTVSKFIKRKKISSSLVNVLHKKREIRQFHVVVVQKCTKKRDARAVLLFYLSRELKQHLFWATHVNRKWTFFSFNMPWRYQICTANCLYSCRDDLPKLLFEITAQVCKESTLFDARRSKTLLLKLPVDYFESHMEQFSYDLEKWFR